MAARGISVLYNLNVSNAMCALRKRLGDFEIYCNVGIIVSLTQIHCDQYATQKVFAVKLSECFATLCQALPDEVLRILDQPTIATVD